MQLGNHADATLSTYPSLDFREEKISNGVYHDFLFKSYLLLTLLKRWNGKIGRSL